MKTNMMWLWIILMGATIFIRPDDGHAQFYQYKDKSGAIVYTDDLSKIPVDKRDSVKIYNSSENKTSPEKKEKELTTEDKIINIAPPAENFDSQRQSLYKEYENLIKEKDQLEKEKGAVNTPSRQEAYNKKVDQLNKKIDAFESRIKEFNTKASQ